MKRRLFFAWERIRLRQSSAYASFATWLGVAVDLGGTGAVFLLGLFISLVMSALSVRCRRGICFLSECFLGLLRMHLLITTKTITSQTGKDCVPTRRCRLRCCSNGEILASEDHCLQGLHCVLQVVIAVTNVPSKHKSTANNYSSGPNTQYPQSED